MVMRWAITVEGEYQGVVDADNQREAVKMYREDSGAWLADDARVEAVCLAGGYDLDDGQELPF